MRRKIIGGGARRCRQKQPVAGQFVEPRLSVYDDLQLCGLVGLAEKVDPLMASAVNLSPLTSVVRISSG